jgi:succinate dehydrogenase/fumarate reductase cytochrome b subunit
MALTGLIIVGFLFGHSIGNLQYFLGSDPYNTYADFLQSTGELLWIMRGGLILCIILHIISAVYLRIYNNAAKPTHYKVKNYVKAKLTSRTMLWTGLLIAAGAVFHLLHFTTGTVDFNDGYNKYETLPTGDYVVAAGSHDSHSHSSCDASCETGSASAACSDCASANATVVSSSACADCGSTGAEMCEACKENPETCSKYQGAVMEKRHDVHAMVGTEFSNVWVAIAYIVFVCLVGFHLNHAIQSAVHTIGIEGPKFTPCMRKVSVALSVILVLLFIILPLSVVAQTICGCSIGGF